MSSYPILNYLFVAVSLTKYNDIDKYKYSGYALDLKEKESFQ